MIAMANEKERKNTWNVECIERKECRSQMDLIEIHIQMERRMERNITHQVICIKLR